ncbi:MAG: dihydrolipoamide acetyltransferase family protein [Sphaerochaetaceae bacterium]|jgi:pyruvate dehydrogenase E2 component (dihydrolipoamide acetyltransferase)|nr:dihydrolipoamide acetyltransferase family protein [Sphaerochaetaceae bacterium]MDD4006407.1 dihydrolipoamide acetyltransferase family protein [Sphaerochaetaceae bacterium]MDD4397155.1 dihydrolipoamide acetyltransferase family protein [Sphaerochaetaceae bacterium]
MIKEIKMPSAGQTTDQATICSVNVKKGDIVKRGDILVEAETDKATLPVESFANGTVIDIKVSEGDTVDAGTVLMVIGDAADAASYKAEAVAPEAAAPAAPAVKEEDEYQPIDKNAAPVKKAEPAVSAAAPNEVKAMPNAKQLAKQNNVDLAKVTSANGGLIKKSDVEEFMKNSSVKVSDDEDVYAVEPQSRMRKAIAARMLQSCNEIPSFQISINIDMTGAIKLKNEVLDAFGVKISYNDIMCKALAVTAKEFPLLNARYENNEIRVCNHTNIGIAVGLDNGLVVPVVKHVDQLSLKDIAAANKANIGKARDGQLLPSDMGCGSVSLSNLGMFDVDEFTAIVNPPESCIFAIGSIRTEPVFKEGVFVPCSKCNVTVSFDHRMIDGSYGAKLLKKFKAYMENPSLLLF